MTNIYVVRHCETEGNVQGVFQGWIDMDISELGAAQLEALGKRFEHIKLDAIISSPLIRTQKTAGAIRGDRDIPIILDNDVIEINGGIYEGKPFRNMELVDPSFPEIWNDRIWDLNPPKGESAVCAYERIWNAVRRAAEAYKGQTVAIATHGGVGRFLLCKVLKDDIKAMNEVPFGGNTAVSLLEFDEENHVTPVYVNDVSHLDEKLINPKAKVPVGQQ